MIDRVKRKASTKGGPGDAVGLRPEKSVASELPIALTKGVAIDKLALEDGLQSQPDLFWQVSEVVAELISDRDSTKYELADVEAEADERIRKQAARAEESFTVQQITALRVRDPAVKRVRAKLLQIQAVLGKWEALQEAYKQRSGSLKGLVSLYTANYYGADAENQDSRMMREQKKRHYVEERKRRREDD